MFSIASADSHPPYVAAKMERDIDIGPIFLQTIPILAKAKKIWTWTGIIFDWMIVLRIFVFRDHLKGHFWNSQQPIIVYEVSWLNYDNLSLYHVHYALLSLKKKQKYRINTLWAWTRFKKPTILNQDRNRNIGPLYLIERTLSRFNHETS